MPRAALTHQQTLRSRDGAGFTLIELMITVAIVAVLAAVAYPSYIQYVVRSNRSAAEAYLLELTGLQQRFLLDARTYAVDMATLGASAPTTVSQNYGVTTAAPTATTFTVTATPIAGGMQATKDTKCGTLTIDQAGTKTASGSGGVTECW